MFIAHLPAGYLLSDRLAARAANRKAFVVTGLAASIVPDLDLLWFYGVDNRQTNHHEYLFHWPLFWLAVAGIAALAARMFRAPGALHYILVAALCLQLHMILDSMAGYSYWLRPFAEMRLNMVVVPARFDWWVLSFVFHWTFMLELVICALALWVFCRRRRAGASAR